MAGDHVVLWRECDRAHDLSFEILQIGEGEFELRVRCDGRIWLEEDFGDVVALMERAQQLHADVHARPA